MSASPPKVFICHAGEDDIFARELGVKLRENGVESFVDEWEILPGDRLIDRIFGEGIALADSFIIILSSNSVMKPWVKEELDAALIRRIEERMKIIPIRIDDCEVPLPLRATAWLNIDTSSDYAQELEKILSSIFDSRTAPPIGKRPERFAGAKVTEEYSLEEESIIRAIMKMQHERNYDLIAADEIAKAVPDISADVLNDTVEILEGQGAIDVERYLGMGQYRFGHTKLTCFGWDRFAKIFLGINPRADCDEILALLVSESTPFGEMLNGHVIHEKLGIDPVRINYAVDLLELMGFAVVHRGIGTEPFTFQMIEPTAESRRRARRT